MKLQAADLMSLETYARARAAFRARVLEHKKNRLLHLGPDTTWIFEDRLTMQYQVQEILRTERIFEPEGIAAELEAYNPLIPDGQNLKVTLLIEFPDADVRRHRLAAMKGIEDRCWMQVAGHDKVLSIADEDMERENDEKTSSVHFLRFQFGTAAAAAARGGAALSLGIDHPAYAHELSPIPENFRQALAADFE